MELDPGTFFTADERLDFALVAVAPATDGRLAGETFGSLNRAETGWGKVTQLAVTNGSDRSHDIEEYLADADVDMDVAAEIGGALSGRAAQLEATAECVGGE